MSSHRPIWQCILDRELTEVARMVRAFQTWGPRSVIQCRVDGVVACVPKKDRKKSAGEAGRGDVGGREEAEGGGDRRG